MRWWKSSCFYVQNRKKYIYPYHQKLFLSVLDKQKPGFNPVLWVHYECMQYSLNAARHTHTPPTTSITHSPFYKPWGGGATHVNNKYNPNMWTLRSTCIKLFQISAHVFSILMETPASPLPTWALCYVINPNLTTGCRQGMRYAHLFSAYKLRCLFKYFSCQLLIKPQPCNASPGFHHKGVFVPAFFFFFLIPQDNVYG